MARRNAHSQSRSNATRPRQSQTQCQVRDAFTGTRLSDIVPRVSSSSRILVVLVKDLAGSLEDFGVGGLGRQKSFQSSGAAERNAAYPTSGTLLVRATGTGTNGLLIAAYLASSAQ